jgi:RNA polymerase sigma-70 factor (ECF subfamily)
MDNPLPNFDPQTIASLQAGDHVAWDRFIESLGADMLAFVRSRHAGKAEDLCQTIWLKAWRARNEIVDGNLRSWLFRIARNLLIDEYRKTSSFTNTDLIDLAAQSNDSPDPRIDALAECMKSLDDRCRQLVQRFYFDGLSTTELSKELLIAPGTIGSRASRCREKLKECIEKK